MRSVHDLAIAGLLLFMPPAVVSVATAAVVYLLGWPYVVYIAVAAFAFFAALWMFFLLALSCVPPEYFEEDHR